MLSDSFQHEISLVRKTEQVRGVEGGDSARN